jgi:hypothetical protein
MRRLVAGDHRLVLGDLRLDIAVVEGEEQVAGLDELAVDDVLLGDLAVDARLHHDAGRRLDEADGALAHRHVGLPAAPSPRRQERPRRCARRGPNARAGIDGAARRGPYQAPAQSATVARRAIRKALALHR